MAFYKIWVIWIHHLVILRFLLFMHFMWNFFSKHGKCTSLKTLKILKKNSRVDRFLKTALQKTFVRWISHMRSFTAISYGKVLSGTVIMLTGPFRINQRISSLMSLGESRKCDMIDLGLGKYQFGTLRGKRGKLMWKISEFGIWECRLKNVYDSF